MKIGRLNFLLQILDLFMLFLVLLIGSKFCFSYFLADLRKNSRWWGVGQMLENAGVNMNFVLGDLIFSVLSEKLLILEISRSALFNML